jgi:hypothetical protein
MQDIIDALDNFLEAAGKLSKARVLKPVQRKLEKGMTKAFTAQGRVFLKEFKKFETSWPAQESNRKLREAFISADELEEIFDKALLASLKLFADPLDVAVHQALMSGSASIISQLGFDISFDLKNPRAVDYIKAHGADLVTQMDKTTRGDIRVVTEFSVDHGWSYSETAQAIQRRFTGYYDTKSIWSMDAPRPQGHIDSRAHLISVTESGEAYETGNYLVVEDMKDGGLEIEKHWSTMKDDVVSDGCRENEAEGYIPADQAHASGHMHPLRFPGCRCDELYRRAT